jgi:hypothetical protein
MGETNLQKKIALYYAKLPPKMQEIFSKMEWLERLRGISMRYNLTEVQIQTLGTETSLVMLGAIHPDVYEQNLLSELAVPKNIAVRILEDLDLEVLKGWKGILAETYAENTRGVVNEVFGNGQLLSERWSSLPKEMQEAIVSSNYQNTLLEIGKKNSLNIREMGGLDIVTTKMMLGTIHPEDYGAELAKAIGIPKEKGDAIAQEVNEKILKNIRRTLVDGPKSAPVQKVAVPEPKVPLPPYKKAEIPLAENIAPKKVDTAPVGVYTEAKVPNPVVVPPPLPNYTEIKMPDMTPAQAPTGEAGLFHTAGIDIVSDGSIETEAKPMTEKNFRDEEEALLKSGVDIVEEPTKIETAPSGTRESALSGIENPPNVSSSIMQSKLSGVVVSNAGSGAPHGTDKYREEI